MRVKSKFFVNSIIAGSLAAIFGVSLFGTPNQQHSFEDKEQLSQRNDIIEADATKTTHSVKENQNTTGLVANQNQAVETYTTASLPAELFLAANDPDTTKQKEPQNTNPYDDNSGGNFNLKNPSNVTNEITYDPKNNSYTFQNKVGSLNNGPAGTMDLREYIKFDMDKAMKKYWKQKSSTASDNASSGFLSNIRVPSEVFENIFGSNLIEIRPSGSLELTFKNVYTKTNNENLALSNRKRNDFDFDENIQINLKAKIGDKIAYDLNYNTKANFDFENKFKLRYEGKEDEIIKVLEFGNVNMPLNSSLIQGSQTLFGGKAQLQFGKLMLTTVIARQDGDKRTITLSGGSELNKFDFRADDYEADRHFFIAQYFYEHYNEALATLPLVNSKINITRIEVWRTNIGSAVTENRNVIAFADLGEIAPYNKNIIRNPSARIFPDSASNNLLVGMDRGQLKDINRAFNYLKTYRGGMISGIDFEKVESARLLSTNEYDFNPKLGFISLHNRLNPDQVLAVAFQYTVLGDSTVYQVGQFSNEVETPSCLVVKLLKSTSVNPGLPMWKLMMKNVYSLNTYQLSPDDFRLNVVYRGEEAGVAMGYFSEINDQSLKGVPLIRILGADRLDKQQAAIPDGFFDYIDGAATTGGTVQSSRGRVYFPKVEPFGKDLREALKSDPEYAEKYAFDSLYTTTKVLAQQQPDKNKFYLEGSFKSSMGSMISLGMGNLAQGSVVVTAGGITLQENADYTVDYSMGMLRITNEAYMQSGIPINVSVESQSIISQKKTMFGLNAEYKFSDKFVVGATILNLRERMPKQILKINFGEEPINNTIWGMNVAYQTESRWITKMLNYLPFYRSTTNSRITLNGEFAHFIPGHTRNLGKGKDAALYIDDFEAAVTTYDLKNMSQWKLASTPQYQYQAGMFPEAAPGTELRYGYNRALISWYSIDYEFFKKNTRYGGGTIDADMRSLMYSRQIPVMEVFPNRPVAVNLAEDPYLHIFDIAYYPTERGPYNYDALGASGISSGLNRDGTLKDPASRWGGIMRKLDVTDFENNNVEYIRFWMLDPFLENPLHKGGKFYINLGDISEDILRDGRKFFEHGLPADGSDNGVDYTTWGRVPVNQSIVVAFDANASTRRYIDVGLDGLYDSLERVVRRDYLNDIQAILDPAVYQSFVNDPSGDNYHYYRGEDYNNAKLNIQHRYKYFNNTDGNSPTDDDRPEHAKREKYLTIATSRPDEEDINNDNTMSEDERYFQYVLELRPNTMSIGQNYITDVQESSAKLLNGQIKTVKWYQFKIPIREPDKVVGSMTGYNSIRFMRMFLKGFEEEVVLRFAELSLVRGSWRQCSVDLHEDGGYPPGSGDPTMFNVSTLSLEENAKRKPIPYVMPGAVQREEAELMNGVKQLNEQSLTMKVVNLEDGDARAIYKNTTYDFRRFGSLKLYLHGERVEEADQLKKGDLMFFVRLGSDFKENYYEYAIPFELTNWYTSDSVLIWPRSNELNIKLQDLIDVKQERNIANRSGSNLPTGERYIKYDANNIITVVGNPNLGDVRVIMMGISNPKKKRLDDSDDQMPKSVEVWVNELRLSDFEEKSGWAAQGSVRIDLSDLGDVAASASISTAGFGALEARTYDRQIETTTAITVATNIQLGKLLPSSWGMNLPVHYDFSRNVSTPEYNPLNPDVKLRQDLKTYETKLERDSIKRQSLNVVQRQNFNIISAGKTRTEGKPSARDGGRNVAENLANVPANRLSQSSAQAITKPKKNHIWDIENFDFSYSYTEEKQYNVDLEYSNLYTHMGEIGYGYNNTPKKIQPFAKVKKMQSQKWLQLFYDLHFYPLPRSLSFRTNLHRTFQETKMRNTSTALIIMEPYFAKTYEWSREYKLAWDFTASLKFDYSASAKSLIDEPQGRIDTKEKKRHIRKSFGEFGTMNDFSQRINASYHLPIDKIPIFSFINSNVKYSASYTWAAAPKAISFLGNTIENNNTKGFDASLNIQSLYNKSKYLRKVNQGTFGSSLKDKPILKKNQRPTISAAELAKLPKPQQDSIRAAEKEKAEKEKNIGKEVLDNFLRLLMMVKTVSFSYTEGNAISLNGFMLEPDLIGLNIKNNGAPGFLFVFGDQDEDLRYRAAHNGWLTTSDMLNTPYQQRHNTTLNFKVSLEPIKDLRVEISGNRTYAHTNQSFFVADTNGVFADYSRQQIGNFSITTFCAKTFFAKDKKVSDASSIDNYKNPNFENFKRFRVIIANRLAEQRGKSQPGYVRGNDEFPDGYGSLDQEVLLYAFWAAYSGQDPEKVGTGSPFFKIPLPNWTISYNGLTRIPGMNKHFQSFTLRHGYSCLYQIGGFSTNLAFDPEKGNMQDIRDALNNFIPYIEVGQVAINESMNPLIGFEMSLKNSFQFKAEWRKNRTVTLSMANFQVTENSNNELVFGAGYRIKGLDITFNFAGVRRKTEGELTLRADFSLRDTKTVLRKIEEDVNQASAGQRVLQIAFNAEYLFTKNFSIRVFYDHNLTQPALSNQYKTLTISAGLGVKITLNDL